MSDFKILSDADHIRLRAGMYAGSITTQQTHVYTQEDGFHDVELNEGLLKILSEILDNSLDEYVRTQGEFANKIEITLQKDLFSVKDNGRGIPIELIEEPSGGKIYRPVAAWSKARAGSNFNDDERTSIGANGIGSYLTNVLSKSFIGTTDDGIHHLEFTAELGNTVNVVVNKSTKKRGTSVSVIPDFNFFGMTHFDEVHVKMLTERIKALSVAFPDIKFVLNGTHVKVKSASDYYSPSVQVKTSNGSWFGISKSNGSFDTSSLVNGLVVPNGGTHIDLFVSNVTTELAELIRKKKKVVLTPSKIKSYMNCFSVINGFKALKFDSQTKTKVTNSQSETKVAIGEIDYSKVAKQLFESGDFISDILAFTKFQEDLEAKKALSKLEKPKKKFTSDKFFPAIGQMKRLFLAEGQSALGGLMPSLGRQGNAFYALKGVPMNSWESTVQQLLANEELSELYTLIKANPEVDIVIASDNDLDGIRIRGLILAFISKYFEDLFDTNRIKFMITPIACTMGKNNLPAKWVYEFSEINTLTGKVLYKKGLGSWSDKDMKYIISIDGEERMIKAINKPDTKTLDDWFIGTNADIRKDLISSAPAFNINNL